MKFRKMVTMTLYARQQKRHRYKEQTFGLCGRGRGWDDLGEWHWNMYITYVKWIASPGSIPTSERSPGEGNGNPLQYSCLENPMDRGAWWATVHGVGKSQTQLSDFPFTFHFHALEKETATHSSVLAWRIPGTGSLVGFRLWGRTESDTTEAT